MTDSGSTLDETIKSIATTFKLFLIKVKTCFHLSPCSTAENHREWFLPIIIFFAGVSGTFLIMLFVWFVVKKKCKSSYDIRKGKLLTRLIYYACGLYGRQVASFIGTKSSPKPPIIPRANPRAFDFFEKNLVKFPVVASLDGQMPHPLELQRGSNPPPSREIRIAYLWLRSKLLTKTYSTI